MARNIQKNYNTKVRLISLVALFLSLFFIPTDINACCCDLSGIFNRFMQRIRHQRPVPVNSAPVNGDMVMTLSPLRLSHVKRPPSTIIYVAPATAPGIMEFDEAEDEDPITLAETGIAATPPPTPAQTTLTALIVDDQSVKIQERFLKQLGFEVTVLTSGVDAIAFFKGGNVVDLVVMDYNMPGMTGLNATDSIRTAHPDLSALFFLYSTEDKETKRAALAAEFTNSRGIACKLFDGEIPKPCSKPQLEEVIRQRFDLISRAKKK